MSPLLICPTIAIDDPDALPGNGVAADGDEAIDLKKAAVLGEPIVGVEAITLDHRGRGALPARPLPSPKEPTQAAIDRHNLTHLPYEPWCPGQVPHKPLQQ